MHDRKSLVALLDSFIDDDEEDGYERDRWRETAVLLFEAIPKTKKAAMLRAIEARIREKGMVGTDEPGA